METLQQVQQNNPHAKVAYSPVFRRKGKDIKKNAIALNKVPSEEVFLNAFAYIDGDLILYSILCKDGLHINEGGFNPAWQGENFA